MGRHQDVLDCIRFSYTFYIKLSNRAMEFVKEQTIKNTISNNSIDFLKIY